MACMTIAIIPFIITRISLHFILIIYSIFADYIYSFRSGKTILLHLLWTRN